jgi:hypothetical protein
MQHLLSSLALLACPVGMGLMMWMMMRGGSGQSVGSSTQPPEMTPAQQTELAQLRAELDQLRSEERGRAPGW